MIKKFIYKISNKILSYLYPEVCPFCGHIDTGGICEDCKNRLPYIDEPRCMRCGKPLFDEETEFCYDCAHHAHIFEKGYSVWLHTGAVKDAIYQFKFHNRRQYGKVFAEELYFRYESAIRRWNISYIIPIPLNSKRRRQRGYNQAEILAFELGKQLGISVLPDSLVRVKNTKPQKTLAMSERKKNLEHAFRWRGRRLRGNVLLIDDIYTTGNTIDSAANTVYDAGASKVYFLTISIGQGS